MTTVNIRFVYKFSFFKLFFYSVLLILVKPRITPVFMDIPVQTVTVVLIITVTFIHAVVVVSYL